MANATFVTELDTDHPAGVAAAEERIAYLGGKYMWEKALKCEGDFACFSLRVSRPEDARVLHLTFFEPVYPEMKATVETVLVPYSLLAKSFETISLPAPVDYDAVSIRSIVARRLQKAARRCWGVIASSWPGQLTYKQILLDIENFQEDCR